MKNILILLTVFILSSCGEGRKITRIDRDTPKGKELWSQIENNTFQEMKNIYGNPTTIQTRSGDRIQVYWDDNLLIKEGISGLWCQLTSSYNSEGTLYKIDLWSCNAFNN